MAQVTRKKKAVKKRITATAGPACIVANATADTARELNDLIDALESELSFYVCGFKSAREDLLDDLERLKKNPRNNAAHIAEVRSYLAEVEEHLKAAELFRIPTSRFYRMYKRCVDRDDVYEV